VVGVHGTPTTDPSLAIADADIVIGYGRGVLEAMACGRAAYVLDHLGGDGWVTPDRYPALESDGFGGRAESDGVDADRLRRDLREYDPGMGLVNRDLIVANHRAAVHAQELVALLEAAAPPVRRPAAELLDMSHLVRLGWRSDTVLRSQIAQLHQHAAALEIERDKLAEDNRELREESHRAHRLADERDAELQQAKERLRGLTEENAAPREPAREGHAVGRPSLGRVRDRLRRTRSG